MKKIDFKKIEGLLEDILDSKTKAIDLIAENGDKRNLPDHLFDNIDIYNSVFIGSRASLFIGLYTEIIKEITGVDFDTFKKDTTEDIILNNETTEDLIIDIGNFLSKNKNAKESSAIKKYKSHAVSFLDLKNILKWFEVCHNNSLKIHII
jgi:hypothetical protein